MKAVSAIIVVILILLALASGVAKILLMEQDVNFFGKYGISGGMLIAFGFVQVLGGLLMTLAKTRFTGAAIVAITFLASLVMLLLDGNIPVSIVTGIALLLLGAVMTQSWRRSPQAAQ